MSKHPSLYYLILIKIIMKKFYLLIVISGLFFSCTTDSLDNLESENIVAELTAENSNLAIYKGVFTTLDSEHRGIVEINIPKASETDNTAKNEGYPKATINLHTGDVYKVYASEKVFEIEELSELEFVSPNLSFKFLLTEDNGDPEISEVQFNGKKSSILVANHTVLAPVTAISGTYSCINCNGHPFLDTGMTQTFNMIFSVADGEGSITTQTLLGSTEFLGIGYQHFCISSGDYTNCFIKSGDGITTNVGYLSNGNPVYWAGIHSFNTEPAGNGNNCDGMFGLWSWESISYGTLTGLFQSDSNCYDTPNFEDLNDFDMSEFSPTYPFQAVEAELYNYPAID